MALTQVGSASGTPAKGIAIKVGPTASGTVAYQVPAGRMFTGTIAASNEDSHPFALNGVGMYSSTNYRKDSNGFELGPGNVVTTVTTSTQVVVAGIERDLA